MAILNVTPDSFADGGRYFDTAKAVAHGVEMFAQGAVVVDVGGESTRPGATGVDVDEELNRVIPVISALKKAVPEGLISIDSSKPEVMRQAVAAGAGMINDVNALRAPGAVAAAAKLNVPVCLMHAQGTPRTMQHAPTYRDVVLEVKEFLQQRVDACVAGGIPRSDLWIDPGFGFGKSLAHNLQLLAQLTTLSSLGLPVMVGISRKSMLGTLLNTRVEQRVIASVAAAVIAVQHGAKLVRVHDVEETVQALKVFSAVTKYSEVKSGE